MERLRISATDPDADGIARAVAVLRSGGVVAYPTDTLYGLAVDPRNAAAVSALFRAKGRTAAMAIPLIAASIGQARSAGRFDDRGVRLAQVFWPGPLSLVVPADPAITPGILGGGSTVAIRVPAHGVARALADAFGGCITATSANLSGAQPSAEPDVVAETMRDGVDLLLDAGGVTGGPPSTIVEVTSAGARLVRAGAVPWERVLESLE